MSLIDSVARVKNQLTMKARKENKYIHIRTQDAVDILVELERLDKVVKNNAAYDHGGKTKVIL